MNKQEQLEALLADWEEQRQTGSDVSIEEICKENPELVFDLSMLISHINAAEGQGGDDSDIQPIRNGYSTVARVDSETKPLKNVASLDEFSQRLIASELMDREQVRNLRARIAPNDAPTFASQLIQDRKLTGFQSRALLEGQDIPLVLDRYVLLGEVGKGGMGAVYKALHQKMDRIVALKILPKQAVDSPEKVQRFQREVRAAAKLDHPNIVTAYDAHEDKGYHFLVMSLVNGKDLAEVVRAQGPFSCTRAVDYIAQAARGFEHAHSMGIVHRDVKPANLLLDDQGKIKILDMGLARFDEGKSKHEHTLSMELTQTGMLMGTVGYLAPEQAMDTRTADARSDIYSLGCTLFYLLTGRPLYSEDTVMKTIMAHQHKDVPALGIERQDVPKELVAVFEKMVAKSPEARFQSMAELLSALEDLDIADTEAKPAISTGYQAMQNTVSLQDTSLQDTSRVVINAAAEPAISRIKPSARKWTWVAAGVFGMVVLMAGLIIKLQTPAGTLVLEIDQPEIVGAQVVIDGNKSITIKTGKGTEAIQVTPDQERHKLEVQLAGFKTFTEEFTYDTGNEKQIRVSLIPLDAFTWPKNQPAPAIAPFTAEEAMEYQESWAKHLGLPVEIENSHGMKFRLIPPGEFIMGSSKEDIVLGLEVIKKDEYKSNVRSEGPQHKVILTKPFYLCTTEVTQSAYEQVMKKNPSNFTASGDQEHSRLVEGLDTSEFPVEGLSWLDAAEFCAKLSQKDNLKPQYFRAGLVMRLVGDGYRLPTEAEWEFACRAGTTTRYWTGDKAESVLSREWTQINSGNRPHEVAQLKPNPFGLFDMAGNVWEWTQDHSEADYYAKLKEGETVDPTGPSNDDHLRIVRGGHIYSEAIQARSSARYIYSRGFSTNHLGFRLVLPVEAAMKLQSRKQ